MIQQFCIMPSMLMHRLLCISCVLVHNLNPTLEVDSSVE